MNPTKTNAIDGQVSPLASEETISNRENSGKKKRFFGIERMNKHKKNLSCRTNVKGMIFIEIGKLVSFCVRIDETHTQETSSGKHTLVMCP